MTKFKTKIIRLKGNNPEPCLYEINKLGLEGWKLEDVTRNCIKKVDTYTYSKPKWWVLF